MKTLIITLLLGLSSITALGEPEPEQTESNIEIKLDFAEPDWALLGDGNWSPWYITDASETEWNPSASFNAWMDTIPEEDKAWPILVDLRYKYDAFFSSMHFGVLPDARKDYDDNGIDDWAQLVELFDKTDMKPIMDQLLDAMSKPTMGMPLHPGTGPYSRQAFEQYGFNDDIVENNTPNAALMTTKLGHHRILITTSKLSQSYFAYLANEGQITAFTENFIAMYRGSWLGNEQKQLVSTLTVMGSQTRSLDLLRWTLFMHGSEFSDEQLILLDRVIADFTVNQLSIIGDQLLFHDTARRIYNFPEMTNLSKNDKLGLPLSMPYDQLPAMVKTTMALSDRPFIGSQSSSMMYHFNDPKEPKWYSRTKGYDTLDFPMDPIGRLLLDTLMPATSTASSRVHRLRAHAQAMRLAITTHRHKLRHGSFPATIKDFDHDLIDFEYIDPFVGGDMIYRLHPDTGPMIYARGYDGDDDQGRHGLDMYLETMKRDGDFLYYPNPWATQKNPDED